MNSGDSRPMVRYDRRRFLMALAAGIAGSVFMGHGRRLYADDAPVAYPWDQWLLDAENRDAVMRLGTAYRADHPTEDAVAVLSSVVDRALTVTGAGAMTRGPDETVALLRRRVREEYARGEVVMLTGWILSITEARLYALVSLSEAGSR